MSKDSIKTLLIITMCLLFINPIVLFAVSNSLKIALAAPVLALALLLFTFKISRGIFLYCLSFTVSVSILLHSELVFISNFSEYDIEELYNLRNGYYFNKPLLKSQFQDKEYQVSYFTNTQGYRIGSEDQPDVELEEIDWLFIGDSYTQGAQVEYEQLYTSIIAAKFPARIILNTGISGWGIPEEYNFFLEEGSSLSPNVVFLQVCNFNDFMKVKARSVTWIDYLMTHSSFARFLLYGLRYSNPAELPLGRWAEPFYPERQSNMDFNIFYKNKSSVQREDLESFSRYISKFKKAVEEHNAKLVIVQIPTKEQVSYKYFEEAINAYSIDVRELDMLYPNKYLDSLCQKYDIKHIDLLDSFSRSQLPLFFDFDEHLNIRGHEKIAEVINKYLADEKQLNSNVERLSKDNAEDRYPTFVGTNALLFQSIRDQNIEIFTSDAMLNNQIRLTFNSVDELHPTCNVSEEFIAFTVGDQTGGRTKVCLMNRLYGYERQYITSEEDVFGAIPSFSEDGSKLTYAEWTYSGAFTDPYLVTVDLSTLEKTRVTYSEGEHWRPIFGNDSESLIFIKKDRSDQFDIFQIDIATGKEENLTSSSYDEWDPTLSPDKKYLAFAARKEKNWDLFLLRMEDKALFQLTTSKGDEWDPEFSPDGDYLYYAGRFGLTNGIYRMKLDYNSLNAI